VKEALGKSNAIPSIDFDTHGVIEIPYLRKDADVSIPEIPIDYTFNPFESKPASNNFNSRNVYSRKEMPDSDWQKFYNNSATGTTPREAGADSGLFAGLQEEESETVSGSNFLQLKGKYILTAVKSGIMVIDQKRAHLRILYEQYIRNMAMNQSVCQRLLFPSKIDLSLNDYLIVNELMDDLNAIGFEITDLGSNSVLINGIPGSGSELSPELLLEQLIEEYKQTELTVKGNSRERISVSLASAAAIPYGKVLSQTEMQHLVDELFACENPNYTPAGRKIVSVLGMHEIDKLFNQ
jgi:DNA mismatch repair protein MutL